MQKRKNNYIFRQIQLIFIYFFPVVLYFSYHPILSLPIKSDSMNLELSLPLIWLAVFTILSLGNFLSFILKSIFSAKSQRSINPLIPLTPLLLPLYLSISFFWSKNPVRTLLTAGVLWCLYVSIYSIVVIFTTYKRFNPIKFLRIFLLASSFVCLFCWLQCALDVSGVAREVILLCQGCTSRIFGFPHPSGFAIEPQFMGSLLIAPTLLSFYLLFTKNSLADSFSKKRILCLSIFYASTLFVTFSRGAIYSFLIGFLVFLTLNLFRRHFNFLWSIPIIIISFLITLSMQGLFAHFSYTNDTFLTGIEKAISQLSLGTIELNLSKQKPETSSTSISSLPDSSSSNSAEDYPAAESPEDPGENSVFSGYVEESTNIRLELNLIALELSASSPKQLLFGSGLGSAGNLMYEQGKTASKKEIIQNEYLSMLLETGIIGLLLTFLMCIVVFPLIKKSFGHSERFFIYALILSFALSLNFFSGLPNALHIYLFPVLIALALPHSPERQLPPSQLSSRTQIGHKPRS